MLPNISPSTDLVLKYNFGVVVLNHMYLPFALGNMFLNNLYVNVHSLSRKSLQNHKI